MAAIEALAESEHHWLIEARLAPYLAGRDAVMDLGYKSGIGSQPERLTAAQIVALDAYGRAAFEVEVADRLGEMADEYSGIYDSISSLSGLDSDPWLSEVRDGLEITALRARFVYALAQGTLCEPGRRPGLAPGGR